MAGSAGGQPPNYWTALIAFAGIVVSLVTLILSIANSNADETKELERRLCRLEAQQHLGECGR